MQGVIRGVVPTPCAQLLLLLLLLLLGCQTKWF